MEDVARAAGVDKATVSRALKGDRRISSVTRERVRDAARALGYRLNVTASSLSGGRTGIAAVVLGDLHPWLSPTFFRGLHRTLARLEMDILLKIPESRGQDILPSLLARRVDCIAWLGAPSAPLQTTGLAVPLVTAGFSLPDRPAVLLSEENTLRQLERAAGNRPMVVAAGEGALFPFLSACFAPFSGVGRESFVIYDGVSPDGGTSGCRCVVPEVPESPGLYRLEWPGYALGVALGRVLMTALQARGGVPSETFVAPMLRGPDGDTVLSIKET